MVGHPRERARARREDPDRADLREAYDRGRRDARAGRRRHPVLMTLTVLAAVVGVVLLALAAWSGSFGRAGRVVDENLSVAADRAQPAVRDAAQDARRAIGEATRNQGTDTADSPG